MRRFEEKGRVPAIGRNRGLMLAEKACDNTSLVQNPLRHKATHG